MKFDEDGTIEWLFYQIPRGFLEKIEENQKSSIVFKFRRTIANHYHVPRSLATNVRRPVFWYHIALVSHLFLEVFNDWSS